MKRKRPKLNVLPQNPTGARKVPKPQVKPKFGAPFSQRDSKARTPINIPGVKTR